MSLGCIVLASDVVFNREVGGDTLLYFNSSEELASKMDFVESNPQMVKDLATEAQKRVRSLYGWDAIAGDYYRVFQ